MTAMPPGLGGNVQRVGNGSGFVCSLVFSVHRTQAENLRAGRGNGGSCVDRAPFTPARPARRIHTAWRGRSACWHGQGRHQHRWGPAVSTEPTGLGLIEGTKSVAVQSTLHRS